MAARLAQSSQIPLAIIITGCAVIFLNFGPRSAVGLFQLPLLQDTGWDRSTFAMAIAIQNLFWGLGQPLFGGIADKYGAWRVLLISGLLGLAGLLLMAKVISPTLFVLGGALMGLGISAGSFSVILSIFARNVAADKRSIVFGIATAVSSAAMLVTPPFALSLIKDYGWSQSLIILGVIMLAIPILAIPLKGNAKSNKNSQVDFEQTLPEALKEAMQHKSYVLLTAGFFVCGFQVAFIVAHFPAYLADIGIRADYAVWALALIGLFNIFGSLGSGFIGQIYSKRKLLSWIYLGRSVVVIIFILAPQSGTSVIIFASVMGILWLSTVAPTNALVAVMFGTQYMGLLGGIVFLSHQIGSFLGIWMGGYFYDLTGSYDIVWWSSIALGIFAAIVHLPIKEQMINRTTQTAAAV